MVENRHSRVIKYLQYYFSRSFVVSPLTFSSTIRTWNWMLCVKWCPTFILFMALTSQHGHPPPEHLGSGTPRHLAPTTDLCCSDPPESSGPNCLGWQENRMHKRVWKGRNEKGKEEKERKGEKENKESYLVFWVLLHYRFHTTFENNMVTTLYYLN